MTTLLDHVPDQVRELSADAIFDLAQARRIEQELPYAGAVTPVEAWQLVSLGAARIVDVRTPPEFKFVGSVPGTANVEWRGNDLLPGAMFIDGLRRAAGANEAVLLLCRSGVRSHAAARAATDAGFRRVYNVLEGFEGQRNHAGHRGEVDGWRRHGLPWTQD
jgi:rhodanese-related sulfurtransferase